MQVLNGIVHSCAFAVSLLFADFAQAQHAFSTRILNHSMRKGHAEKLIPTIRPAQAQSTHAKDGACSTGARAAILRHMSVQGRAILRQMQHMHALVMTTAEWITFLKEKRSSNESINEHHSYVSNFWI
mgnify:CR=1 FL=1